MSIGVKLKGLPVPVHFSARRTLDGNILILDHEDMDIIVMQEKKKCLALPKDDMSDKVYSSQDRMYKFLVKKGVIDPGSVRGGNIFGSMEADILESSIPGVDSIQATLYSLYEYVQEERPYFTQLKKVDDDYINHVLHPDSEHSTELGDVPHSDKKGSMDSRVRPFGMMYNYSVLRESEGEED